MNEWNNLAHFFIVVRDYVPATAKTLWNLSPHKFPQNFNDVFSFDIGS